MWKMEIDIEFFDMLYYEVRLAIRDVARLMNISVSTLYVNATKRYGRKLRDISEANIVAMEEGRWNYPNDPLEVDWERVRQLRKDGKSFAKIGKEMGYAQANGMAKRVRMGHHLEDGI